MWLGCTSTPLTKGARLTSQRSLPTQGEQMVNGGGSLYGSQFFRIDACHPAEAQGSA
jgi:hypothetical protein